MAQYTIKQTKSLSPVSYSEIEARVIREDGKVYLAKQDEERIRRGFFGEDRYYIKSLEAPNFSNPKL